MLSSSFQRFLRISSEHKLMYMGRQACACVCAGKHMLVHTQNRDVDKAQQLRALTALAGPKVRSQHPCQRARNCCNSSSRGSNTVCHVYVSLGELWKQWHKRFFCMTQWPQILGLPKWANTSRPRKFNEITRRTERPNIIMWRPRYTQPCPPIYHPC